MSFQWFGGNTKRKAWLPRRPLPSNKQPRTEGPQICPVSDCQKQFFDSQGLFNHQLQTGHFDNYCCLCNIVIKQSNIKRHIESVHSKTMFSCWMCEKKYNREDNLKAHQFKVHGMATCRYCQAAFRDKESLRAHVTQGCLKKAKSA